MTWIVIAMLVLETCLLAKPFALEKTGLETFDALDNFENHASLLLCLALFAVHPSYVTGFIALSATAFDFKGRVMVFGIGALWLQLQSTYL